MRPVRRAARASFLNKRPKASKASPLQTAEEFLANQSDSSDDESTRQLKRQRRAELRLAKRPEREAKAQAAAAAAEEAKARAAAEEVAAPVAAEAADGSLRARAVRAWAAVESAKLASQSQHMNTPLATQDLADDLLLLIFDALLRRMKASPENAKVHVQVLMVSSGVRREALRPRLRAHDEPIWREPFAELNVCGVKQEVGMDSLPLSVDRRISLELVARRPEATLLLDPRLFDRWGTLPLPLQYGAMASYIAKVRHAHECALRSDAFFEWLQFEEEHWEENGTYENIATPHQLAIEGIVEAHIKELVRCCRGVVLASSALAVLLLYGWTAFRRHDRHQSYVTLEQRLASRRYIVSG